MTQYHCQHIPEHRIHLRLMFWFIRRWLFSGCKFAQFSNKKVLLRERKRHTARRVVSTHLVVQTGYPPAGYPPAGYPPAGYPPGRVPPRQGTPSSLAGPGWVPPLGVCPMEFWVMLQSIMVYGYPPSCPMAFWVMLQSIMGYGYPPPLGVNKLKTLPSPSFGCGR